LIISVVGCAVAAGILGATIVLIGAGIDPNSTRVGGSNDPAGVAILALIACGFAGSLLGLVVGLIGALAIGISR
jgi:hypothetical protein